MSKRVYCLYRVSTKGQVERDDIPMQRQVCHEYARQQGWEITKEFYEKGVSGFKVSAKDRDAVQEIQRDAAQGDFDILLVFMFDRLGRKEDETPFIVEWFVRNGIEVWSAVEGQQRFDSHVDKLMNYIRYWQASGESLKTSVRVKTRLGQLVQEGRFRGGVAPYGYRLVKRGRVGKKNRELYDIEIEPQEAAAIREIFELSDRFGYGGRRISSELQAKGIVNLRSGEPFHYSSIQNILKNIMYVGILRSGDSRSEIFPDLQIIPPEQFERVSRGQKQRSAEYAAKCDEATLPRKITGKALLSGNLYCGHCGGKMFASTARKSHHPSATPERVAIYKCYNRTQHKALCDGPTSYRAEKVDRVIEHLLEDIFSRAKGIDAQALLAQQLRDATDQSAERLKQAQAEHAKAARELEKWEDLMLASVERTCVFTPEQVKRRMDAAQERLDGLANELRTLQTKAADAERTAQELLHQHSRLLSWAELFADATPDEKKLVAANLIRAVRLTRNYGIEVDFNISEAQYLNGLEME